jgi:hypothetical protein
MAGEVWTWMADEEQAVTGGFVVPDAAQAARPGGGVGWGWVGSGVAKWMGWGGGGGGGGTE